MDDDTDIRDVGQLSLEEVGRWKTLVASSGAEAIEVAAREQPDVILLDVMMPGKDGLAVLAELRARPDTAAIPVIFMTAKAQKHEIERFRRLGATGIITKPFDPMALPDDVRGILQRRR